MNLFNKKGEREKDYDALLGQSEAQILELTPQMSIDSEPLNLDSGSRLPTEDDMVEMARREKALAGDRQALLQREDVLKAELAELKRRENHLNAVRENLADDRAAIESSRAEMKAADDELTSALANLDENSRKLEKRESTLRDLRVELNAAQTAMKDQQAEIEIRAQKVEDYYAELGQQADDLIRQRQSLHKARAELKSRQTAFKNIRNQLEENWALLEGLENLRAVQDRKLAQKSRKIEKLTTELSEARDALGSAEYKAISAEDQLALVRARLVKQEQKSEKRKALKFELLQLQEELGNTSSRLNKLFDANKALAEQVENKDKEIDRLIARQDRITGTLKQARNKLMAMQRREDSTQSENALLVAQNRAMQLRQEELNAEVEFLKSAAPEKDRLIAALRHAKIRETELLRRLETSEKDLAMMEKVTAILKEKASSRRDLPAFSRLKSAGSS